MRETLNLLSMNSLSEQESLLLKKINLSEIITSFLSKQQDQPIKSQIRPNVYQKANETGFKLILENLLSNAIKYSTANSEIKIVLDKNHLEITNQIANPKKLNLRKLFQRNYRGENQNDQDGNGIGLAIAKELCRAMKWRITAIKEEDRLRITITFR
jgi:signal transduction histidine kinase